MSSSYVSIPGFDRIQGQPPVNDIMNLPAVGNNLGDVILVLDTYISYYWSGSAWVAVPTSGGGGGSSHVIVDSSALPSGASTSSLQTTGNTSLASIDSKTPSLGQQLAAASSPVVLTAAQLSTLTPLSSISVSNFPATQPVSGSVSVSNFPDRTPLTASSPTSVSVGITSSLAIAANSIRKGLVFINLSAGNISFGVGVAAVLNSGITLTPNGVWEMDEFTFNTNAINAIAANASSNLAVQELS